MSKTHFSRAGGNKWAESFYHFDEPLGNVFYVNSATGTDGTGYGYSPEVPTASIDYAVGLCTASNHDFIIVMPGHVETVVAANGLDFDVAGITVIGKGVGSKKPVVNFTTLTTATARINAADVTIRGLKFTCAIDSQALLLNVAKDDATIEDCDFVGASTTEFLSGVNITTTFDNTTIRRCRFIQPTDPAGTNAAANTGAIYLVDSENVIVEDCEFRGNFETACVHNRTTGCANFWMNRCYGQVAGLTTDSVPFVFVSTATGGVRNSAFNNPNEAAATEATLSGTFPAGMFNHNTTFGNDGGGGQKGIASQADAS